MIRRIAGTGFNAGSPTPLALGQPATSSDFFGNSLAVDAMGRVYTGDWAVSANAFMLMVDTDGTIHAVAGTGVSTSTGNGGPPMAATVRPFDVAVMADGAVALSDLATTSTTAYTLRAVTGLYPHF
jgi:uncharacterized cupin superfamily protein